MHSTRVGVIKDGRSVSPKHDSPMPGLGGGGTFPASTPLPADALTAAERRVAELAADGMSNREIAQTLFVTVKTVEWHLRNTYVKLAIGSRQELQGLALDRRPAAA